MGSLKKANAIGTFQTVPTKKLSELKEGDEFKVDRLKISNTKYGDKIIATLVDNEWEEFQVFLPERFAKNLTEEDIRDLNKNKRLWLTYKGMSDCGNKMKGHVIEFFESSWGDE